MRGPRVSLLVIKWYIQVKVSNYMRNLWSSISITDPAFICTNVLYHSWSLVNLFSKKNLKCLFKINYYRSFIYFWILKQNFQKWWSTIPPIFMKQTTTSHLKSLNIKKTFVPADCLYFYIKKTFVLADCLFFMFVKI
jgi:hypothetical protein